MNQADSSLNQAFDNQKYLDFQILAFKEKLAYNHGPIFIEFGGKPFDDQHASRVLPGYDPDNKAHILKSINPAVRIVMVVNAKDILHPPLGRTNKGRIRGDSGLRYDLETIRLINRSRELGLQINDVVLSVTPFVLDDSSKTKISGFRRLLDEISVTLAINYEYSSYQTSDFFKDNPSPFSENDSIAKPNESILIFSPGGGSGKFGVILSEMYKSLARGENPFFIKFETFPVFHLSSNHALNLSFEAATADLGNKVISIGENYSNYDKDIANFKLLQQLFSLFPNIDNPIKEMTTPIDMGINQIEKGILDNYSVISACRQEIIRRINRYQKEIDSGDEKQPTLNKAVQVLEKFNNLYPNQ